MRTTTNKESSRITNNNINGWR